MSDVNDNTPQIPTRPVDWAGKAFPAPFAEESGDKDKPADKATNKPKRAAAEDVDRDSAPAAAPAASMHELTAPVVSGVPASVAGAGANEPDEQVTSAAVSDDSDDLESLFGELEPSHDTDSGAADVPAAALADAVDVAPETTTHEPLPAPASAPAASKAEAATGKATEAVVPALRGELTEDERRELEAVNMQMTRNARYTRSEQLYPFVDAILGVIQSDDKLQTMRRQLTVTQDEARSRSQMKALHDAVSPKLAGASIPVPNPLDVPTVFELVYDELVGLGPVGPFFRDPDVTEIMIDAWDRVVIERNGLLVRTPAKFRSEEHARTIARNMSELFSDRRVSPTNPIVTAELPDARVQFAYGQIVQSGLSVTLRKFKALLGMDKLIEFGSLTPEMAAFLADCVAARANVLVSGGTGTGKTTFINALSSFIPDSERVITIESAFELQLTNTHWVPLRTKERSSGDDDSSGVNQADLLVATLRMRPDRIVVGEIRKPYEATVMLEAANTGHDGTMTTVHANDPVRAMRRMTNLVRTDTGMPDDIAQLEVCNALDVIVQVTRRNQRRFVSSIAVVDESCLRAGKVSPDVIFSGELVDGAPVMRRVSGLRADTELALKMSDSGIDTRRWE